LATPSDGNSKSSSTRRNFLGQGLKNSFSTVLNDFKPLGLQIQIVAKWTDVSHVYGSNWSGRGL